MPGEERTTAFIEDVGRFLDLAGVLVIVAGLVLATVVTASAIGRRRGADQDLYKRYRRGLGRSILLGLEILVAADIVRTVAVRPTFESVGVLAVIVLIRTFLSVSLELEVSGRWPWQQEAGDEADSA